MSVVGGVVVLGGMKVYARRDSHQVAPEHFGFRIRRMLSES